MARLRDLEARFVQRTASGGIRDVEQLYGADGVMFTCPKCGGHQILAWFVGRVPSYEKPGPGRWTPSGDCLDNLSLYPSVDLSSGDGCRWHGWVKSGSAE